MNQSIIPKYTLSDKLIWSLASLGGSLISGIYAALLLYFYQVYLGLDAFLIAIAAGIYAVWNALNDPLFGYISDSKSFKKKGRRIPYMRYTTPLLAFGFILVWFVPLTWDNFAIFLWMLISMLIYDTAYTIIFLMQSALLPEITEDDHERGEFNKYAGLFQLIGLIIGFVIPELLRPKVGQISLLPLYIGVIAVGIIGSIIIIIPTYRFHERPEFTLVDKPVGLVDAIKFTFKSKAFIIVACANFMSIFMQSILLGLMFYLGDYVMRASTLYLILSIFVGLVIGTLFANILAGKFGVVKAQQLLLIIGAIFLMAIPFVPNFFIYVCLFFAGVGISGPLVLTNVLFAQVADEDETISGVRREAMFFGTNALITKPAQSLAIAAAAILLQLSGFIPAGKGGIVLDQPESAIFMMKIVVGFLPGLALLIGALIYIWYPLKGEYLTKVHEKVLRMHEEKHAKLMEKQS
jgi:GPH family glycoside/pentoside/hexuronide:cation symporter